MKKFFTYLGLTVAILLIGGYFVATYFLGSIVKNAVNRIGPKMTQTRVVLDGARISPLTGTGTLTGLTIENPPGWSEGKALYVGRVDFSVVPSSLFKDRIIVKDVRIDQAEFTYESKIVSSNIGDIMKNVEAYLGATKKEKEPVEEEKTRKVELKHLLLSNSKVTVGLGPTALPVNMPTIELDDVGSGGQGITGGQITAAILRAVTGAVVSATTQAAGHLVPATGAAAIDAVKKTGESLKKLIKPEK